SIEKHSDGFGSPLGKLKGINIAIEHMSPRDLKAYNIYEGQTISLEFEGEVKVAGEIITGTRNLRGEIILVTFKNCSVTHKDKILFQSKGDLYNMAVGETIVSAFNGPADLDSFNLISHSISSTTLKSESSEKQSKLEQYYEQIRHYRQGKNTTISRHKVFEELKKDFPNDWLLPIELYELARTNGDNDFAEEIMDHLETVKRSKPSVGHLIDDGLKLVDDILVP
ncbi:MAG: phenylalanine 4-monooxygenase, partial [Pricia sp.]|nr:phenylalanine 4-monooxygenase [Pricia sp.]